MFSLDKRCKGWDQGMPWSSLGLVGCFEQQSEEQKTQGMICHMWLGFLNFHYLFKPKLSKIVYKISITVQFCTIGNANWINRQGKFTNKASIFKISIFMSTSELNRSQL